MDIMQYKKGTAYGFIHVHSDYSLKDGAAKIDDICSRAKEMGAKGLTLTDHGNCAGWAEFLQACTKEGLRAGPGVEAYYRFDASCSGTDTMEIYRSQQEKSVIIKHAHLILIAKNYDGYREISRLMTEAQRQCESIGGIKQPVVDKELLTKHIRSGNVFVTSACVGGPFASVFYCNDSIEKQIRAKEALIDKLGDFDAEMYQMLVEEDAELTQKIVEHREKLSVLKKQKKPSLKARQRGIDSLKRTMESAREKLDSINPEAYLLPEIYESEREKAVTAFNEASSAYESAKDAYETDCRSVEEARTKETVEKEKITALERRRTKIRDTMRPNKDKWKKYSGHMDAIKKLKTDLKTEDERMQMLTSEIGWFLTTFKHDFFIELQYHGIDREAEFMPILAKLAHENGIPVIAANDSHMVMPKDAIARQALMSLRMNQWEEMSESDKELYMKDDAELSDALLRILPKETVGEAMQNIRYVIDTCDVKIPDIPHYPKYRDGSGRQLSDEEAKELLRKLAEEGIPKRFEVGEFTQEYRDRLEYEMRVVTEMGFAHYFLIVTDYVNYAKSLGTYEVGPGRGSGAASLILYLLKVTDLDPLKYKLIFERFLNPERKTMPDIDVDFSEKSRAKTIEYVRSKYGDGLVSRIRTVQNFKLKESIRSATRVIGYREFPICKGMGKDEKEDAENGRRRLYVVGDTIVKAVPDDAKGIDECRQRLLSASSNPLVPEIVEIAASLVGKADSFSMHAGGIVISDGKPIAEYVPLMLTGAPKKGDNEEEDTETDNTDTTVGEQMAVSCDMIMLEGYFKLLKFDFLGLNNLNVLSETAERVYRNHGIKLDMSRLPFEPEVFREIYCKGNTGNVFQVESDGMRSMLTKFGPQSFEDITLLIAAYRPGPMEFIPKIIDVKEGKAKPDYVVPELENILSVTYGYPIYQEQLMDIFHTCAGFTLGEADNIRRAMSKKKVKDFVKYQPQFIQGIMRKGATRERAEELWNSLLGFANYGFNKAHAALYALISYATAYLKYHYPVEYMTSVLNWPAKTDSHAKNLAQTIKMGIKILPPDINRSNGCFEDKDGQILYGMSRIRDTSSQSISSILSARCSGVFTSFKDFLMRCSVDRTTAARLVESGAFDCIEDKPRSALISALPELLSLKKAILKNAQNEEVRKLFENYRYSDTNDDGNALNAEYNALAAYISVHPMDEYSRIYNSGTKRISEMHAGFGSYAGVISDISIRHRTKDGAEFASFTIEDKTGSAECIIFVNEYAEYKKYLKKGSIVRLSGEVKADGKYRRSSELVLNVKEVQSCRKNVPFLFIVVPAMQFYDMYVKPFTRKYEDRNGHDVVIYELETGHVIPIDAKMKRDVMWEEIPGVEIKMSRR